MLMSPAARPVIERVRSGNVDRPEVPLAGLPPARIEILHRRLVDLHIAAGQLIAKDFPDHRLEPLRGHFHAASQRLAWKINAVALFEDPNSQSKRDKNTRKRKGNLRILCSPVTRSKIKEPR